jgi:glycine cleavage system aminomethyltransferase T
VSFEFLSTGPAATARSPMEREALAAGARIERRDGWNVAVGFDGEEAERERLRGSVGFADMSHLGKIELQGHVGEPLELGSARLVDGAWWCPYTPERAIVLCEAGRTAALVERLEEEARAARRPASVIEMTSVLGALTIAGPLAREVFARFTAIDLRPGVTPVHGFRPGSVARGPGAILRQDGERYLMLFGAALGRYMWTVVADACASLGGAPVGVDALEEARVHA